MKTSTQAAVERLRKAMARVEEAQQVLESASAKLSTVLQAVRSEPRP